MTPMAYSLYVSDLRGSVAKLLLFLFYLGPMRLSPLGICVFVFLQKYLLTFTPAFKREYSFRHARPCHSLASNRNHMSSYLRSRESLSLWPLITRAAS